jgi:hypothetical protein
VLANKIAVGSVCWLLVVSGCPEGSGEWMADVEGTAGSEMGMDTGGVLDMPGNDCSVDAYDPNDSRASATSISVDTIREATLCESGDEFDWWTFTLTERSYVGVEVTFAKDAQDVALELWDAATSMLIDRSQGGADMQAIHELHRPGTYEILVERRDGNPRYTLETYGLSTKTPPTPADDGALRVFCPRFDLDEGYIDATPQAGLLEDFGLMDDPNRWEPEAMLVRVLDKNLGNVRLGWGPLDESGCTPPVWTPSPSDTQFVLQYALWSHFVRPPLPDTFMIVYDCEQMQPCVLQRPYVGWTTAQGALVQETQFVASAEDGQHLREELLVYWASAFSESRITMGVDAHLYARVLGSTDQGGGQVLPCPSGYCPNGTTCETGPLMFDHCRTKTRANKNLGGHPTIDIAAGAVDGVKSKYSGAPTQKFTIAHELGHLQTLWVPGFDLLMSVVNYGWCSVNPDGSTHTVDSPEWQSAALVEGFADFYAVAVFNELEDGAWFNDQGSAEDVENDTMRFQAKCQAALDGQMTDGFCGQPGDATMCTDPGASNEIDWAGTLWDFTKVVGESELPNVLRLLSDAGQSNWDPGSTTSTAYDNVLWAAGLRFPNNGDDFNAAAQTNGTNR